MTAFRIASALTLGAFCLGLPAWAQQAKTKTPQVKKAAARPEVQPRANSGQAAHEFANRDELNAYFDDEYRQVDHRRIEALTALAAKQQGAEAERTYQEIFNLAISRDQYDAAEKGAEAYISSGKGDPRTTALATYVEVIAAANRQEYGQAIERLGRFLKAARTPADAAAAGDTKAPQLDPTTTFAVGEAFLQRLIRDGRYDVARKAAEVFVQDARDTSVREHFSARLGRIDMLGKPAPAINAKNIDDENVSLSDYKGKVVLVDFWATWCPPCMASIPHYNALTEQYGDDLVILGVNLDTLREGLRPSDAPRVKNALRQFLVQSRVNWPVVLNGTGDEDYAKAYGVTEIPANFLLDRDGTIIHVELNGPELDKAIAEAVGGKKPSNAGSTTETKAAAPTPDRD